MSHFRVMRCVRGVRRVLGESLKVWGWSGALLSVGLGCGRWDYDLLDGATLGVSANGTGGQAVATPAGGAGNSGAGGKSYAGGATTVGGTGGTSSSQEKPGLLGFWPFDEGAGSVAFDQRGPNDGTFRNAVAWVPGQVGSAIRITEVEPGNNLPSDNAVMVDLGNVSYGRVTAITLSLWMRSLGGTSVSGGLVSHMLRSGGTHEGGYSLDYEEGQLAWSFVDPATKAETTAFITAPSDGTWHHVAATWDAVSATILLYVDGTRVDEWPHVASDLGSGPWPMKFGQSSVNNAEFEGELDQIRIYDRVLTAREVGDLAREGE